MHRRHRRCRRRGRRCRLRHAHAAVRHDVPPRGASTRDPGRGSRRPRRRCCATRPTLKAIASYESILSAGGDWDRIVLLDNHVFPEYGRREHRLCRYGTRTGAASRPSATSVLAALPDTASPDGHQPLPHRALSSERRSRIRCACLVRMRRRSRPTARLPAPPSTAPIRGPPGSTASPFAQERLLTPAEAVRRLTSHAGRASRPDATAASSARVLRPTSSSSTPTRCRSAGQRFEPNQVATGVAPRRRQRHRHVAGTGSSTGERAGQVLRRT